MSFRVYLEGVGLSLINRKMQEIMYASLKQLDICFVEFTSIQKLDLTLKWFQIDNQLLGCLEPIFMYPTKIPKDTEEDFRPVLLGTLTKSKDSSYGLDYYHFFSVLLQELSFELDEDFLMTLMDFFKFDVAGWEQQEGFGCKLILSVLVDTNLEIPKPVSSEEETRLYCERFFLQPVKINVSFYRTQAQAKDDDRPRSQNIIGFVFDVFTMAVGNITDAPFRMNALELHHPIVTYSQLFTNIMTFYSSELVGQIHKVIGSADVLGNPVGLFNSVSSGVWDLFYEPIQGFEITRPQDFGVGLAKGGASLVKKTVFGFSDTVSKFTGSISKGLSVVTLDKEFQEQRRMSGVRNRPKHAVYGVTQGITSFAKSVGSGVEGLVAKPMEGAEKEGVAGFFKGLGKGVVGFATKPIIGVFDLASNVTEGIRNTTTVFEVDLDRQRLPRFIGKDGILKVFYYFTQGL